jgi:hypothetical protein
VSPLWHDFTTMRAQAHPVIQQPDNACRTDADCSKRQKTPSSALRTPFKTLVLGSGLIHEKGCPLLFYPNRFG